MAEAGLMSHLRTTVWGPAEFVGLPPRRLLAEGLFAGVLAVVAITGVGAVGAWTGRTALAGGEAGLIVAVALGVYLLVTGAGRALVGIVAVLGACLALLTPQAAAGLVLEQRGRVQPVVVTAVEGGPGVGIGHGRYLCSVASPEGVPLSTRIWRGCGQSTRPGDALEVVYDPEGKVPPRGVDPEAERGRLAGVAALACALVAGCAVAVVRSFRLSPASSSP
ncbi:hypothetical protein GCM10017771_77280 [Streptomyces capitiformicae]|uniref:Uncharacterized protein n=1 Tax=Streptomyces capitiformicae TaxID=2014920 RepID=A0A918ZIP0_9ACTN|nr:hypothetical protein GCM10017771_77280 [Streptomyces capitiformicae]